MFFLVLEGPVQLQAGVEICVFEAAQFKGERYAKGIDAAFVFDIIAFYDRAEVGDDGAGIEAEVLAEVIVIEGGGVEDDGQAGDAEFAGAFVGIMDVGEGELGDADVDASVGGAIGRREIFAAEDGPDAGNTVLGPGPGGEDTDKKGCAGGCCQ